MKINAGGKVLFATNRKLLEDLKRFSKEELDLLNGRKLQKGLYTCGQEFVIDSKKLLKQGQLIDIRTHTRFAAFPPHTHNYVEILYMYSGSTTHIINGKTELRLQTGELLLIGKGCRHEVLPAGIDDIGINFIVLPEFFYTAFNMMEGKSILSDFIIDNLTGKCEKMPYLCFHVADVPPIQNLLENLIWSFRSETADRRIDEFTMGLLFLQLLKYTERAEGGGKRHRLALDVLTYINENYDRAVLSEFAAQEHLPLYSVSRRIKAEFGVPFQTLLQKKRFQAALSYLTGTQMPISGIIAAVGYENTSYFYKKFRQQYHTTPNEYRKSHRNKGRK